MVPDIFDSTGSRRAPVYDPAKARQLLAEAGYPNGFDAGYYNCDSSYSNIGEAVLNNFSASRHPLRSCARSSARLHQGHMPTRTYKNIIQAGSGAFGNAATRMETLRGQGRRLRLWQLSRHRRAVPAAGGRTRPWQTGRDPAQDAANRVREGDVTRRSGSSPSSTASDRAWRNSVSAGFRASPTPRPTKTHSEKT